MDTLLKLGIDWQSILFYFVNFGVLFFLIGKFAVPALLKVLDQRRETIENSIREANLLKNDFQEKIIQMEAAKEAEKIEFMTQLENMRKNMEMERKKAIEEMETARNKMLEAANLEINQRKSEILKEAEEKTLSIIKKIVLYIVQNKIPEDVVKESVTEAWKEYSK
jgi:F-type H+-transporting ATPase subunit b